MRRENAQIERDPTSKPHKMPMSSGVRFTRISTLKPCLSRPYSKQPDGEAYPDVPAKRMRRYSPTNEILADGRNGSASGEAIGRSSSPHAAENTSSTLQSAAPNEGQSHTNGTGLAKQDETEEPVEVRLILRTARAKEAFNRILPSLILSSGGTASITVDMS